ncbi:MAG: glutaredoxin family protein [Chloroflexi bacterium]|nr:glutaredoxin family protein [Chloroflexota bacterium]
MNTTHVPGTRSNRQVFLFALSTCGWCRRTREFLEANGVEYTYIYVDLLKGDERKEALDEMRKWTPRQAFPTIIVGEEVLVGLDEDKLRGALGL